MKYASIVPLIGGATIAMQNVLNRKPEYILSYDDFKGNDNHLVEYYKGTVPYHLYGDNGVPDLPSVEVINTVCPCAGLSSLSPTASSDAAANDWMLTTSNFVLGTLKPQVFWGENAPGLASNIGRPVVTKLRKIGKKFGYTFSIYKTKSILHGLGQVRNRTFYFFWQGKKIPQFDFIKREHEKIEDTIRSVKSKPNDPMDKPTNYDIPSKNPYYRYVLEEMCGGITHKEFQDTKISRSQNAMDYIEWNGGNYKDVAKWMMSQGFTKISERCNAIHKKLSEGGNIMRKVCHFPKNSIGAFVGHMPKNLTHPDEDRYLTIRECLSIMKLPNDFMLQGGLKNLNHICQNVPVTTAEDMATHVEKFVDGRLDNQMLDTDFLIQDNTNHKLNFEKSSVQLDAFMV
tara:strand:- start:18972 stop:20171 length:1200 start_codon:yes stop_codon:yes gene_type:complete